MNLLNLIKEKVVGKQLKVYTNSKGVKVKSKDLFNLDKTVYYDKELSVTILDITLDDESDVYLVFYFKYNDIIWDVSCIIESISGEFNIT